MNQPGPTSAEVCDCSFGELGLKIRHLSIIFPKEVDKLFRRTGPVCGPERTSEKGVVLVLGGIVENGA
jgi:hypothetical protein